MTQEALRFSRFAHFMENDGIWALWHSVGLEVFFLKEPLTVLLQEFEDGVTEEKVLTHISNGYRKDALKQLIVELKQRNILIPVDHNEITVLEETRKTNLQISIGILYLLLTDICNFRCKYCFIEKALPPSHNFSMMTSETAKDGVDLFAESLLNNPPNTKRKAPMVIFYGGEPLLNKQVFGFVLKYIRKLQDRRKLPEGLKISLITNGSLIDEETSNIVAEYNVKPSISLDGPQLIHDQMRRTINGEGTFTHAIRGYEILRQKGIPVSISCTIGPHNIDILEQILEWFVKVLNVQSLGFNLLLETPEIKVGEAYIRKANEKLIQCYQIARKYGIYEDRIMRKVRSFVERKPHLLDCGGYGHQLVISPGGKVGPCHAYLSSGKYFVGDVQERFSPFSNSTFLEWSQRSPFNMSQCFDCKALGICGGGCAYNAEVRNGSIWTVDKLFCLHSKGILDWLIWELYTQTILFRKEGEKHGQRVDAAWY